MNGHGKIYFCYFCRNNEIVTSDQMSNDLLFLGFKWQRQLVFRSKLTMHTAFERKDNKDPAAVTALAVSK